MQSKYEQSIVKQAMSASLGGDDRNYTSRYLAEEFAQSINSRLNYSIPEQKQYQGSITDIVKENKPQDMYKNPLTENKDPQKDIYSALLNYKFIN
jgi:hypothetical protein